MSDLPDHRRTASGRGPGPTGSPRRSVSSRRWGRRGGIMGTEPGRNLQEEPRSERGPEGSREPERTRPTEDRPTGPSDRSIRRRFNRAGSRTSPQVRAVGGASSRQRRTGCPALPGTHHLDGRGQAGTRRTRRHLATLGPGPTGKPPRRGRLACRRATGRSNTTDGRVRGGRGPGASERRGQNRGYEVAERIRR